ncbi:MAG: anaerobic sulfatase maturase [Anaerolineaceae bacterium]|nr:anaerobic sulfatase maturase [Anaerolineaceae bacterium]|tara:strand:- start:3246 stop:4547 length:1302 start_codon:yes stop_codon:yes gene_type:complete
MIDTSEVSDLVTVDPFNVMLKPRGAICNLDCKYCYYLRKEDLYANSSFRMDTHVLEKFVREYIAAQVGPEVVFSWQGGEPTLMGIDYFRQAVEFQNKYSRPGMRITNAFQTNGVLIDDEWCRFFRDNAFLLGISLDGPIELHDAYRVDKGGDGTFDDVMRGIDYVKRYEVEYNILTTVHSVNSKHPLTVYKFLRDIVGAKYIQFIPIVEKMNIGSHDQLRVSERSVKSEDYGSFLLTIYDEWVARDVGTIFVQIFDVALAAWSGMRPGLCVFEETCGSALAMEHNGDLYSCDHFVEQDYLLGNLMDGNIIELVSSSQQQQFGLAKRDDLPTYCLECEVRFVCNGGCPKNRFIVTPEGDDGLNYLCAGYKQFFTGINMSMNYMASLVKHKRPASDVMDWIRSEKLDWIKRVKAVNRNDLCPCGSGKKYKKCCMI